MELSEGGFFSFVFLWGAFPMYFPLDFLMYFSIGLFPMSFFIKRGGGFSEVCAVTLCLKW